MKQRILAIDIPSKALVRKALSDGSHAHHIFAVCTAPFIDSGAFSLYSSMNSSHFK